MDRFEEMRTFTAVVEAGGITAAAERLGIAKSAVSRRLADLEERLSVELFRRTTRRMNLTDTGQGFYERCLRILRALHANKCDREVPAGMQTAEDRSPKVGDVFGQGTRDFGFEF